MRNERLRGYLDAIVLSILFNADSYGYQIAQAVHSMTDRALVLKEGSLYPALKRMEGSGLIEGYWGTDKDTGPRRRYYSLTERGKSHLKVLMDEWNGEQKVLSRLFGKVVLE